MSTPVGGVADPRSIAGKAPEVERRVALVVIGAGEAGTAAAIEAAGAGVEVVLIDENPIDHDLMAMDVPLHFGGRMSPSVRNRAAMLARLVEARPGIAGAYEAGVDVQLGVSVWGAFRNGPVVRELPGPMLGLADERRSWLLGYDRLIVAAGARDLGMGFAGWEKAGVMGANAAASLMTLYGALAARRVLVLGSGALGLETAARALAHGVEVAGVVEVLPETRGDAARRRDLERRGVRFYASHAVREARGALGSVESVVLTRVDGRLAPVAGSETTITCDAVCLALGLVPSVELLNVLGARLAFRSESGGFVPETDESMQTSLPGVFVAGDCAGVREGMLTDPGIARREGRLAGIAAAASLGAIGSARAGARRLEVGAPGALPSRPVHDYWRAWLDASLNVGSWDVHVCLCEEVTRRELAGVQPPRYLRWESEAMRARSLATLATEGPVNPDQVKRLTRAGMGPCQGRRCREQVALLLAREAGTPIDRVPLASYRPPVRPLPLSVLWPHDEPQAVRDHWVSWFGIPDQFGPHWQPARVAEEPPPASDAEGGVTVDT